MSNPSPSPGNRPLDQLKVAELRDELRKRGLSLKGVKKDLFERLDEAVRKEQAGFVGENEVQGDYSSSLPHYHNTGETSQDDDGMSYLNDVETTQDTSLIVNNASPYVGASDATPVFVEPCKDADILPAMEEKKDDASTAGGSSLPEDIGEGKAMLELDNSAYTETGNEFVDNGAEPGNEGSGCETAALESGSNQATEAITTSSEVVSRDTVLPCPTGEGGVGVADGTITAQEIGSTDDTGVIEAIDGVLPTPAGDDIVAGESAIPAQEFSVAEVASISDVVIPLEGDNDVPSASVSDEILNAAAPAVVDPVVNASDSPMQDVEVFERTVLTSVSVVPCVQESGKESVGGALEIEMSEKTKKELEEEDTRKGGFQEGGEAVEAVTAAAEVPMVEAGRESQIAMSSEEMHGINVQPVSVLHEEPQDIEMSEAQENLPIKLDVSEVKPLAAAVEAPELPVEIKSEDVDNIGVADTANLKEAPRGGAVGERILSIKSEPREAESRISRRAAPVENVKAERQETRDDMLKNGRSFERSRPRDHESDRSRHNAARAFDDRGRMEGRSGRHFKEEVRKDIKESASKPEEGFDVRTGQKRKDDDRDAKQQEPAKRVRRWNSGKQPAIEVAKPLTSGTVNEIVSPEVKREDLASAPPKLTPKLSGPIRPVPPAVKAGSEANGDKRVVPPSTRPPSTSLKIERFVRPFTLKAVKDLLAEFGECVDFWMDQIKTHCYVTYSTIDEAVAARNGLYDRQWPPSFGNLLVADFVEASEVKMRSDGTYEKMNAPVTTTPRGFPNHPPALGAQHGHSNALASAPPLRERQFMQVTVKEPEPPVPTLDDLFRKTKAKPHIYYLPLTDEQVAEKLAAAKNKDLQPVRGRPVGRV